MITKFFRRTIHREGFGPQGEIFARVECLPEWFTKEGVGRTELLGSSWTECSEAEVQARMPQPPKADEAAEVRRQEQAAKAIRAQLGPLEEKVIQLRARKTEASQQYAAAVRGVGNLSEAETKLTGVAAELQSAEAELQSMRAALEGACA